MGVLWTVNMKNHDVEYWCFPIVNFQIKFSNFQEAPVYRSYTYDIPLHAVMIYL